METAGVWAASRSRVRTWPRATSTWIASGGAGGVAAEPAGGGTRSRALGAGTWEARLPLAPGVYRVNLRVDGGPWIVPPGLPSVVDEFGGAVGILTIE